MSYKLYIQDNSCYLINNDDNLQYEGHAKDVLHRRRYTTDTDFAFTGLNYWDVNLTIPYADLQDKNGDPWSNTYATAQDFSDYLDSVLGKSNPQGGGAQNISGWIDYNDTSAAVNLVADTWTDIPNNGAGAFSNRSPLPLAGGITDLIDTNDGSLIFSNFKIGDDVFIRHDFSVVPDTNNATLEFRYFIGQTGQEYPLNISIPRLDRGSGIPYQETGLFYIYMGDENTRLGGARLQVRLSTTGTLSNNGIAIKYFIY